MRRLRLVLLPVLSVLSGCNLLRGTWQDEPSVVSVYALAVVEGEQVSLDIATTGTEGDWSYDAFASARLEGLQVMTPDGAPVQTGAPTFTPASDHGGTLRVPLPNLDTSIQKLTVTGEFFGLDAAGHEVVRLDFKDEVKLAR